MKQELLLLNHSVADKNESIGAMLDGLKDVTLTEKVGIIYYDWVPFHVLILVNDRAGKLLEGEEEHLRLIN